MRALTTILMAAAGLGAFALPAAGQGAPKIAYIDSRRLIAEAPGAKEAQESFERDMNRYRAELQQLEDSIKSLLSEYEQKQVLLSPEAKRQKEEEIRQKQRAYQERAGELENEAARRQSELVEPIMDRIQQVLTQLQKEGGYAMIFDAAAGALVAADTTLDITNEVLRRLRQTAATSGSQQR